MKDSNFFFGMTRYHSQSSDFFRDFSADVISSGNEELAEKSFCKSKYVLDLSKNIMYEVLHNRLKSDKSAIYENQTP